MSNTTCDDLLFLTEKEWEKIVIVRVYNRISDARNIVGGSMDIREGKKV